MARSSTITKLPLDTWAKLFGINPLQFNQVQLTGSGGTPNIQRSVLNNGCTAAWFQYEYQAVDRVGREEVARLIREAEDLIETYLGFNLIPSWTVDERVYTERPYYKELITGLRDIRGYPMAVIPKKQYLVAPGVRTKTLIDDAVGVAYTDTNSDLYFETATALVNTTITDPCEIRVYYPGKSAADQWEIRPVNVVISGGVATITFRREQCVIESLQEALVPQAVLGTDNASFLTTVDVYRVWNDTSTQATLVWEPVGGCSCGGLNCPSCAYALQSACLYKRGDDRIGALAYQPASYDVDDGWSIVSPSVCRNPDAVRLWYVSGYQAQDVTCPWLEMDNRFQKAVAYIAASRMDRPPCGGSDFMQKMRNDISISQSKDQGTVYTASFSELNNPFGTKIGELMAWRMIRSAFEPVALGYAKV